MLQAFKKLRFEEKAQDWIAKANSLQAEYAAQGFSRLTLRQIHYQFVTRLWYENTKANYKTLGQTLSKARIAGLLDWEMIEDRGRQPHGNREYDSLADLLRAAFNSYRLPRWAGQSNYVELWVEKEALAGVLLPLASEYHVTVMVNKGYSSSSAMKESADRFIANCSEWVGPPDNGNVGQVKRPIILYLGDHDPSGEDMVRDIVERMTLFGVPGITVEKVALTYEQAQHYKCPTNFIKLRDGAFKDARGRAYAEKFGRKCWEVDALSMPILQQLIREAIEPLIDMPKMNAIKRQEVSDKKAITKAAKRVAAEVKKKERKATAKLKAKLKKAAAKLKAKARRASM